MKTVQHITADMTLLDIVAEFNQTEAVFRRYDSKAGVCLCCEALFDSLTVIARQYGLALDELIADLEAAISTETLE